MGLVLAVIYEYIGDRGAYLAALIAVATEWAVEKNYRRITCFG
jgi:hypothetical protein